MDLSRGRERSTCMIIAGAAMRAKQSGLSLTSLGRRLNKPITLKGSFLFQIFKNVIKLKFQLTYFSFVFFLQQLKSISVQVPGLKPRESRELVNVVEGTSTPVKASALAPIVVPTPVVQVKAAPQPSLVSKTEQLPVPVVMRQTATPSAQTSELDPDEGVDSAEEHGCCVAHHQCGPGNTKKGQKHKKPMKVKTRSGRVSRPPKHTAKDYKFLKVGDSIQDSSVDSDDFSEMSSEEEVDGEIERAPRERQTCVVKNTLFQCEKCEKSYMGKGGLFRHFRLHPTHGQMDPSFVLEAKKGGGGTGEHKVSS